MPIMIQYCLEVKASVVTPVFHRSHLRVMVLDLATFCARHTQRQTVFECLASEAIRECR